MTSRVWNSLLLKVLCIISVLVSPACFAFSQIVFDQILEQSPDTMKIGLMALAAVFVFLLLLVIFIKIQL
ncbi:MAG: epidermal growth factor receptor substrate 15, partial [Gammaproteobacteria bacterium]